MKKTVSVLLVFVTFLMMLAGCGKQDEGPVKSIDLPADGIVTKAELESVMKNKSVLYIKGNSNGFDYQWVVFGTKIENPRDTNFSVSISEDDENKYAVQLAESIEFSPSLSFRVSQTVDALTAPIYNSSGELMDEASVSSYSDYTDICFYVTQDETEYNIVLASDNESAASDTASDENSDVNTPEGTSSTDANDSTNTAAGSGTISNGQQVGQDQYLTDPVPEGKPLPVEPENQTITDTTATCTFSISCATILNNMDMCDPEKVELVPSDGWILKPVTVSFNQGESVFDVLQRVCSKNNIHMEFEWTPIYNSAYIEGIQNLYEFDVGSLSGWMYSVNGWFPNYGCSRYVLQNGDTVNFCYTCDLGYDVGGGYTVGG